MMVRSLLCLATTMSFIVARATAGPPGTCEDKTAERALSFESTLPFTDVEIAGKAMRVLIDTGAGTSLISENDVELDPNSEPTPRKGYTGDLTSRMSQPVEVKLSPCLSLSMRMQVPLESDNNHRSVQWLLGQDDHALLGRDVLDDFLVELDLANGSVRFRSLAPPLKKDRKRWPYLAKVNFEGQDYTCHIDTGLEEGPGLYVTAGHPLAADLRRKNLRSIPTSGSASRTGMVDLYFSKHSKIAGIQGSGVLFSVERLESEAPHPVTEMCVVGSDLLRQSKLTLIPQSQYAVLSGVPVPPSYNRIGIGEAMWLSGPPRLKVGKIHDGSPAAASELEVGDEILEINKVAVGDLELGQIKQAFYADAGTMNALKIQRGDSELLIPITNADYLED